MAKILLVDDSRFSRMAMKHALGDTHHYIEAENGLRGLELYFIEKPDLVLLDLTMPEMNGLELLAQLRTLDQSARVVVITADVQELTREEVMAQGALAFIAKPIDAQSLCQIVETALEKG